LPSPLIAATIALVITDMMGDFEDFKKNEISKISDQKDYKIKIKISLHEVV